MQFTIDLHLHSRFSRAVSPRLNLTNMAEMAAKKGIDLLATGDWTHPAWLAELTSELISTDDGFFKLKNSASSVRFVLSCEISSIYTDKGVGRRVHNIVIVPTFEAVQQIRQKLISMHANLDADGRPIVSISSRNLVEIALEADPKSLVIPAHAWTPWFAVFGSKSGYDSLKDAFGDMEQHVYAIETGLSSDPAMNWRINDLDNRAIMSFSDAHSLENFGREATILEGEFSYEGLYEAITLSGRASSATISKTPKAKIVSTIEFYPEEGKYHFTGHRLCEVSFSPKETKERREICPVCGRPLTVGVMHRIDELADSARPEGYTDTTRPEFLNRVPLREIIAESMGVGVGSKKVVQKYEELVKDLGSEFKILNDLDVADIEKVAGYKIAEGVAKVRAGDLVIKPGFDGQYGQVHIWNEGEKASLNGQTLLF